MYYSLVNVTIFWARANLRQMLDYGRTKASFYIASRPTVFGYESFVVAERVFIADTPPGGTVRT